MPTDFHGWLTAQFVLVFAALCRREGLRTVVEGRLKLAESTFRVPDLALHRGSRPSERVVTTPPLVVVEILSPDDRMADLIAKFREYAAWGVQHCWLADPETRDMYVFANNRLSATDEFAIPEFGVVYGVAEIFEN
jgi:Uma2 family endonuclease